jgi:hypothetical protein
MRAQQRSSPRALISSFCIETAPLTCLGFTPTSLIGWTVGIKSESGCRRCGKAHSLWSWLMRVQSWLNWRILVTRSASGGSSSGGRRLSCRSALVFLRQTSRASRMDGWTLAGRRSRGCRQRSFIVTVRLDGASPTAGRSRRRRPLAAPSGHRRVGPSTSPLATSDPSARGPRPCASPREVRSRW